MKHNWFLYNRAYRLGYLPILRNGNMFFRYHFMGGGWIQSDILEANSNHTNNKISKDDVNEFFCPVRHPKDRFVSALVEILNTHYPKTFAYFNRLNFANEKEVKEGIFFLKVYHNDHIYPISYLYSEIYDKIVGIPMDHPQKNTNELMIEYFNEIGMETTLSPEAKSHVSGEGVNKGKEKFQALLATEQGNKFYQDYLAEFFQQDLELYNRARERFS